MKNPKERVIAIDYFRGLCILAVAINHSWAFSMPFTYIAGAGGFWTSAAEMFLLLSGLTFAVVRGDAVLTDFKRVLKKTWRRAAIIYFVDISMVVVSLLIALSLVAHNLPNDVLGTLPSHNGFRLMVDIFTFSYSIGWATFLMYYSVLLLLAPFIMRALRTRFWITMPLFSILIFIASRHNALTNIYYTFGVWQTYFVAGLTIGRFRKSITAYLASLKPSTFNYMRTAVLSLTAAMMSVSILLNYNIYHYVAVLTDQGWLPVKLKGAYMHFLTTKPIFDNLFMNIRTGSLRPVMALLVFTSAYLIYQKHKEAILYKTGSFMITMGHNTMAVFAAQAIAIPAIAALGLPKNLWMNALSTSFLILLMWVVAQFSRQNLKLYVTSLRNTFYETKHAYLQQHEDS
jgi:hypothetical protein